jgi:two-component SAPR family response regulator
MKRCVCLARNTWTCCSQTTRCPGLNGIELARQATLLRRDLKIIFMTGYRSRAGEAKELGKLLLKPFGEMEMIAAAERSTGR